MKGLKLKEEFKDMQVGFNGSGLPLGLRDDLHILAQTAIESGDQSLLNLFESIPTKAELLEQSGEAFLKKVEDGQETNKTNSDKKEGSGK